MVAGRDRTRIRESGKMVAKSCTKNRALKAWVYKKPDTDSARHCTLILQCAAKGLISDIVCG